MTTRPTVVVNGIILNGHQQILLTLRRDIDLWCLPGGFLESGESVIAAVVRELKEEIGVEAKVVRCSGIYSEPNIKVIPPAKTPMIVIAFECKIVEGTPGVSDEVAAVEYFDISELPPMVQRHKDRIFDAITNTSFIKIT